jgi:CHASE2 domain-containing sensor protein
LRKPKPGFWWLFFYGRRRRGVPWLLVVLFAAALLLGLTFAVPGADQQRVLTLLGAALIAILLFGSLLLVLLAWLRPRGRR